MCVFGQINTYVYIFTYNYECVTVCGCMYINIHKYMHIYTYIYTLKHIWVYTYVYTYIHDCTLTRASNTKETCRTHVVCAVVCMCVHVLRVNTCTSKCHIPVVHG